MSCRREAALTISPNAVCSGLLERKNQRSSLDGEERLDSRLASTPCAISAGQVTVVVIAAYGAGLRISEACRLRPEDTTARGG